MKFLLSITSFLSVFFPGVAYAQSDEPAQIQDIVDVLKSFISILAPFAGIAFFVMVIVGGAKFLTSGGDPKKVEGARQTLTYAILGVLLVVIAWFILSLIKDITKVDVTTVTFPP